MGVGRSVREEIMKIRLVVFALLALAVWSTAAFALGKGTSLLSFNLTSGNADIAAPASAGYIAAFSIPEVGLQGEYWNMMADDYAFALSGGLGLSNEKDEPGTGAPSGATDQVFKTSSFNVRVGGDRVAKVGDRAVMYGGPGIEFWSGKAKFENAGTSSESGTTTRISLNSRIGAIIVLNDAVGLSAHVGHRVGRASSEDQNAKATWWTSGFEGAMGLTFMFGGQ
jgi:hypothetical protein